MIPNQVKNLFAFIDFLESNKKNYTETYAAQADRLLQLKDEQRKLSPSRNYKDRQRYDILQKEWDEIAPIIQTNVVNSIVDKLIGLGIWHGDGACASIWSNNAAAISELTRNFTDADAEEVKKHKQMYLTFRAETNHAFRFLDLTFDSLDEVLKDLFDFFKDTERNEFEEFEVKPIRANSAEEVGELFQKGYKKFELPINYLNHTNGQQNKTLSPPPLDAIKAEKYPSCTSETFKTDIEELCVKCPVGEVIQRGVVDQIEFQARQKKEVLTKEQFAKYVENEIEKASKAMERIHLLELQSLNDRQLRGNRIEIYIWNKERIKTLNKLLGETDNIMGLPQTEHNANNEAKGLEDLLSFFETAGEIIRPSKIEFYNDGTHKVKEWAIGKTICELFQEKAEQIKKEVEGLETKCFSDDSGTAVLNLLAQQLRDVIYLFSFRNKVFPDNPEQQEKIEEQFKAAANRLESLLNNVVLPKIEFRHSKDKSEKKLGIASEAGLESKSELHQKIESELASFRLAFNNNIDYQNAAKAIEDFFSGVENTVQPIFVKNGNIKNLAFALGEIWRSQRNGVITFDYLQFYKQTFSIFRNQNIDTNNVFGSSLYKYSLSKA